MVGVVDNDPPTYECEVGGVFNACYWVPPNMDDIVSNKAKERQTPTDGQIFPYVAHYLITGDLIYPIHEGEGPVTALLEELSRLDLLRHLFQQKQVERSTKRGGAKDIKPSPAVGKLRVRTRDVGWRGVTRVVSRLFHIRRKRDRERVYRPPPKNKGTTLVIVRKTHHGSSDVQIHGPVLSLRTLLPEISPINHQQTHHHLNGHVSTNSSSAHDLVLRLEEHRFTTTVRSSWAENSNGALITQWILYRKGSNKKLSSTSKGAGTLGKVSGKKHSTGTLSTKKSSLTSTVSSRKTSAPTQTSIRRTRSQRTKKKFFPAGFSENGKSADTTKDGSESPSSSDSGNNNTKSLLANGTLKSNNKDKDGTKTSANIKRFVMPRSISENVGNIKNRCESCTTLPTADQFDDKLFGLNGKSISTSSITQSKIQMGGNLTKEERNSLFQICTKANLKRVLSVLF